MSDSHKDDFFFYKWTVTDYETLQQMVDSGHFTMANVGELFFAVMRYVKGEEVTVPPELFFAYTNFKVLVDDKRNSRQKIGETRAENGKTGGENKAKNAKIAKSVQAATGYTPPTKKRFKAMINQITEDEMQDNIPNAQIDAFFTYLRDNHWTIKGAPIRSENDLEIVLRSKFTNSQQEPQCSFFFPAFEYVFR